MGDLVTMDVEADVDGKPWLNHKGILYEVSKDSDERKDFFEYLNLDVTQDVKENHNNIFNKVKRDLTSVKNTLKKIVVN